MEHQIKARTARYSSYACDEFLTLFLSHLHSFSLFFIFLLLLSRLFTKYICRKKSQHLHSPIEHLFRDNLVCDLPWSPINWCMQYFCTMTILINNNICHIVVNYFSRINVTLFKDTLIKKYYNLYYNCFTISKE